MIQKVMQQYFSKPVTRYEILRDKDRLVAEVEVDGETYFLKGDKNSAAYIEKIYSFTTIMSRAGLPFIELEKTMKGNTYVEHDHFSFMLERRGEGDEIKRLRLSHIKEIGKWLGIQHSISLTTDFRFGVGTSWGMFGGNETDKFGDYDENEMSYLELMHSINENET